MGVELTRITLVRHGAVDRAVAAGCRHDPPLTAEGRRQVRALAADGRLPRPELVRRSPARRSQQTAELLGWDAEVDDAWSERDLGAWEGRPWAELWPHAPDAVAHDPAAFVDFTPPDAEPVVAVWARTRAALAALPPLAHLAVVTHAGPIVAAVGTALELTPAVALRLRVATGSVTRLTRHADGGLTVEAVGA